MKYIITNTHPEEVIIFSPWINHCKMIPLSSMAKSAGECHIIDGRIHVTNLGSVTLGLKPENLDPEEDEEILGKSLYYGI